MAETTVHLAWDASPDPDVFSYNLYYGETGGSAAVPIRQIQQTTMEVGGLVVGKTYFFYVTAVSSAGDESIPSEILTYSPTPQTTLDPTTRPPDEIPVAPPSGVIWPPVIPGNPPLPQLPPPAPAPALSVSVKPLWFVLENDSTPIELIHIAGAPEIVEQVAITAESFNPDLLPPENILFGGSGSSRQIVMVPAANQHGKARILLRALGGKQEASQEIQLTVFPVNTPPTINALPSQLDVAAGQSRTMEFQVTDPDDVDLALSVDVQPREFAKWIEIQGTGVDRRLVLHPKEPGNFILTLTLQDPAGLSDTRSCAVRVLEPTLTIEREFDQIVIRWPEIEGLLLESSANPHRGWTPVEQTPYPKPGVSREYQVSVCEEDCLFFRLRW